MWACCCSAAEVCGPVESGGKVVVAEFGPATGTLCFRVGFAAEAARSGQHGGWEVRP